MYLSGSDIRPIGCEPAEFIESPTFAPEADPDRGTPEDGDEDEASVRWLTARLAPADLPVGDPGAPGVSAPPADQ